MSEIKAVVVSERCPYCTQLIAHLKSKGMLDKVQLIDADSEEGRKFADENKIMHVPECIVIVEREGKRETRVCNEEEFKKLINGE